MEIITPGVSLFLFFLPFFTFSERGSEDVPFLGKVEECVKINTHISEKIYRPGNKFCIMISSNKNSDLVYMVNFFFFEEKNYIFMFRMELGGVAVMAQPLSYRNKYINKYIIYV